ncbi:MAG: holo-[acyl-carrier protein] synthase [Bacteroidia bacterium]|jgi:holo-[acyl-carrier protein] synthase
MIRVGTDILQIQRIDRVVERQGLRFVQRILTPSEQQEYLSSKLANRLLAKRFAAKEAVAKALGTGIGRGVSWQDIGIDHNANGAPIVVLSGGALKVAQELGSIDIAISIADETDYVVAFAVLGDG